MHCGTACAVARCSSMHVRSAARRCGVGRAAQLFLCCAGAVQAPEEDVQVIDASGLTVMTEAEEEGDAAVMAGGVTAFSRQRERVRAAGAPGRACLLLLLHSLLLGAGGGCGADRPWFPAGAAQRSLPCHWRAPAPPPRARPGPAGPAAPPPPPPMLPRLALFKCPLAEKRELAELEAAMAALEEDEDFGDAEGEGDLEDVFVLAATEQGPEASAAAEDEEGGGESDEEVGGRTRAGGGCTAGRARAGVGAKQQPAAACARHARAGPQRNPGKKQRPAITT